jgi:putative GTP pyrophosphokinase
MTLESEYQQRYEQVLKPLAMNLEKHLQNLLSTEARIDRVSARAKSPNRFLDKALKKLGGKPKYREPFHQIQDQVGARIITFYLSDVARIDEVILRYFRPIESRTVVPDSEWEFGYFGKHHILIIPTDVIVETWDKSFLPDFFELQIKTLFQHAWSEANHDLGYKPQSSPLQSMEKRQLAFTSAQAWGADQIFDQLFQNQSE